MSLVLLALAATMTKSNLLFLLLTNCFLFSKKKSLDEGTRFA